MNRRLPVLPTIFLLLLLDFSRAWSAPTPTPAKPIDMKEAKAAFAAKNYEKTITLLSPHLDVANKEAFLLLGKAYSASENGMMAMKTYSAGLSKFTNDAELGTALGQAQYALKKESDAKATLKEVIENNPTYEPAYLATAEIYQKKNNRYELRLLFQDLVAKVGAKPEYLQELCDLTTRDGLYDQAIDYCKKGTKTNPREPLNYINLATSYKETGKTAEADTWYKKAADSFSKSEQAQYAYAQYLDGQKKFVDSFPYYKRAVAADPKSSRSLQGLGFAAIEIQKFSDSLAAFDSLCEVNSRDGIKSVRKAAGSVQRLNQPQWFEKYSALITKCEER